ncbi:hypothetical protein P1X14_15080 [Sphingomonas sp. AOB5]|uniref:STM3941 family protein n=1 Tax=Sphingomonas sp. AOB5 TaxID=3034017 RepID=UPI0023F711E3|nr:STM3941 family protein [Sphingomonas sp. AOB5]MDF7776578.1 hypothetical protein [Sphingomonas sp. AOB5]
MHFTAETSKAKVALLMLGSVAFVAGGAWMVTSGADDLARLPLGIIVPVPWIGWAAIVFFGLAGVAWSRQFFSGGPVIEISPEGLYYRRWSEATIPWDAFDRAAIGQIHRQRMLTFWLRDPAAWPSTTLQGRTAGANKAMGFGDISLSMAGLNRSFDELVAAFEANAGQLAR